MGGGGGGAGVAMTGLTAVVALLNEDTSLSDSSVVSQADILLLEIMSKGFPRSHTDCC